MYVNQGQVEASGQDEKVMREGRVTLWPHFRQLYERVLPADNVATGSPSPNTFAVGQIGLDIKPYRSAPRTYQPPRPVAPRTRPKPRALYPVIIGTVLVQLMGLGFFAWILTSPAWTVQKIVVQGTHDPALIGEIGALHVTGCNVFRCDLASIERQVSALPAVSHATVSVIYPNRLNIQVSERTPALVMRDGNVLVSIASDGTVLSVDSGAVPAALAHLPVLAFTGTSLPGGASVHPGNHIPALIVAGASQLRSALGSIPPSQWSLTYISGTGFVASAPGQPTVTFGTLDDIASTAGTSGSPAQLASDPTTAQVINGIDFQAQELRGILALLGSRHQHATTIDLRWGAHPYYRLG